MHTHAPSHFHFKHSSLFLPHPWFTCGSLFKHKQRQTHSWHLTCLNRLPIHFTALLDVRWFVCTYVSVTNWMCACVCCHVCWSRLPKWFGTGNKLDAFLCPLLIISPITHSLLPFLPCILSSVPSFCTLVQILLVRYDWYSEVKEENIQIAFRVLSVTLKSTKIEICDKNMKNNCCWWW